MRIRIFKQEGGAFRVVLEPRARTGLRKTVHNNIKKEDLESVIGPAALEEEEIVKTLKSERRNRLRT